MPCQIIFYRFGQSERVHVGTEFNDAWNFGCRNVVICSDFFQITAVKFRSLILFIHKYSKYSFHGIAIQDKTML